MIWAELSIEAHLNDAHLNLWQEEETTPSRYYSSLPNRTFSKVAQLHQLSSPPADGGSTLNIIGWHLRYRVHVLWKYKMV